MPVEAKPLFRPDVLRPHLRSFELPPNHAKSTVTLPHWADMVSSERADKSKEKELLPDFLTDVFCEVLGYVRPEDHTTRFTEQFGEAEAEINAPVYIPFYVSRNADHPFGNVTGALRPLLDCVDVDGQ